MVQFFFIYDQETVMRLIKLADIDRFVLRIMTLQIQRKLLGYLRGINRDR